MNGADVNVSAPMGFLVGDVNASKSVTASDILRAKGWLNQSVKSSNYLYDTDLLGPSTRATSTPSSRERGW